MHPLIVSIAAQLTMAHPVYLTKLDPTRPGISDLATELRLKLYEQILSPTGFICLCKGRSTFDATGAKHINEGNGMQLEHKALCHAPIGTNVLLSCRQIKQEAKPILYEQNTFMFTCMLQTPPFMKMLGSVGQVGPEVDLPLRIVDRVRSAFLFLDSTADCNQMEDDTKQIFAGMASLERIRIVSVEDQNYNLSHLSDWRSTALYAILRNIPQTCKVAYGTPTEAERSFVANAKPHWETRSARHVRTGRPVHCQEIESQRLGNEAKEGFERKIEGSVVMQSSAYPGMYMIFDDVVGM